MKRSRTILLFLCLAANTPAGLAKPDGYEVRGSKVYYAHTVYTYVVWKREARLIPEADGKTFVTLDPELYGKDARRVFYKGNLIPGSQASTFTLLSEDSAYARDAGQVYCYGQAIPGADPASFEVVDARLRFARDQHRVYIAGIEIPGADPATYQRIGRGSVGRDKKDYYLGQYPLHVRDLASFTMVGEDDSWSDIWAYDRAGYYVGDAFTPVANPASFRVMKYGYAKDARQVYYQTNVVANADAGSFVIRDDETGIVIRDKNTHYRSGMPVQTP